MGMVNFKRADLRRAIRVAKVSEKRRAA